MQPSIGPISATTFGWLLAAVLTGGAIVWSDARGRADGDEDCSAPARMHAGVAGRSKSSLHPRIRRAVELPRRFLAASAFAWWGDRRPPLEPVVSAQCTCLALADGGQHRPGSRIARPRHSHRLLSPRLLLWERIDSPMGAAVFREDRKSTTGRFKTESSARPQCNRFRCNRCSSTSRSPVLSSSWFWWSTRNASGTMERSRFSSRCRISGRRGSSSSCERNRIR